MRTETRNKRRFVERQVTKKGSKVDTVGLDGEELKSTLEEKLGISLEWGDYSWEAKGDFNGIEVYLNFTESDSGNTYEIGYRKEGSIHDRSVWEGYTNEDFEKDTDELVTELGDYGETTSEYNDESDGEDYENSDSEFDDDTVDDDFEDSDEVEDTEEANGEEALDFDDFEESKKISGKRLQDSVSRASRRMQLHEKAERVRARRKESETRGKFEILSNYLKQKFAGEATAGSVFEPVFTNNGFYDLETKGLSGIGVWIGYRHGKTGAPSAKRALLLKKFVYEKVEDAVYEYAKQKGLWTDESEVIIEDKIDTTDMFRVYVVTERKFVEKVVNIRYPFLKKFEECTVAELFEKVGLKESGKKYLRFDESIDSLNYMLDECNQTKLVTFLKRNGVKLTEDADSEILETKKAYRQLSEDDKEWADRMVQDILTAIRKAFKEEQFGTAGEYVSYMLRKANGPEYDMLRSFMRGLSADAELTLTSCIAGYFLAYGGHYGLGNPKMDKWLNTDPQRSTYKDASLNFREYALQIALKVIKRTK